MQEYPLEYIVNLMSDLRALPPDTNRVALVVGSTAIGDGKGGFYRWDPTATGTEDAYMNVVTANSTTTGRWVRVFQKTRAVGGGILTTNGGIKSFYISGTTASNGKITLNLTDDNLATGTALFNEIWSITANPQTNATGPSDAVQSYRESLSTNLKQLVYSFYKANAVTITLGMLLTPVASVGAGTVVQFRVDGI